MRLGSGCDVYLLGAGSMFWCPCVVICGCWLGIGVAVSGSVRPLCCHGVVIVVVVVVLSGVDRSLRAKDSSDESKDSDESNRSIERWLVVVVVIGVRDSDESKRFLTMSCGGELLGHGLGV